MIADGFLARLAAEFLKVRDIGMELDTFLEGWIERNPAFADDAGKLRAALATAIDAGTLPLVVGEALAGAFKAIAEGHGEVGKGSPHFG